MIVNNGIRAREVRLIGQDGEQLGIKSKREALQLAEDANLDFGSGCPKGSTSCCPDHGLRKVPLRNAKERA